jgi:hypothetical protein
MEDVSLLEHQVDLLLHAAELLDLLLGSSRLLLHLLEEAHLLSDLGLLLRLLELLSLNLHPGLAALGRGLHKEARFALRDYKKYESIWDTYQRWRWTTGRSWRYLGPWR